MRLAPLALFGLAALAHGEGRCALTDAQIRGLRIWDQAPTGVERASRPDEVRFTFQASLKNETPHELASVSVQLIIELSGKRAYVSPPKRLTKFANLSVSHTGSLLPLNKTEMVRGISFDVPARLWRTDSHRYLRVVGAEGFTNPNLHDPGHLYNFLVNGKDEDQILVLQKDPSLLRVKNAEGLTPLLMAFATCGPKMIRYLTTHGASPKEQTKRGATIMHMAALNGYPGVMDLALKMGGNVNARTKNGKTPLLRSIVFGRPECWRWLLAHGANPNYDAGGGWTAAHYAIQEGQLVALQDLVKAGVSPRAKDSRGQGLMHYAVFNNLTMDTVMRLGVPIDDPNPKTGETPLMLAAWAGWEEPRVWLLQHGADPNRKDKRGRTAYDYAAMRATYGRLDKKGDASPEAALARRRAQAYFAGLVERYATKR